MNICITALFLRDQLQLRATDLSMEAEYRQLGVSVNTSSAFTTEIGSIQGSQRIMLFSLVKLGDVVLLVSVLKEMVASDT